MAHSETANRDPSSKKADERVAFLVHIGQCHQPLIPDAFLLDLRHIRELNLGRGTGLGERVHVTGPDSIRFLIDDPCMSTQHARINQLRTDTEDNYVFEDTRSTNGCLVNGRIVMHHELEHRDIIETGQTFWMFYQRPMDACDELIGMAYSGGSVSPSSTVSMSLLQAFRRARLLAAHDAPVVILGDVGTGRQRLAEEVHRQSGRRGDFVVLDCVKLDDLETIQGAHQGTLLLTDIDSLSPAAQARLLDSLQSGGLIREKAQVPPGTNARLIATASHPLSKLVEMGVFNPALHAALGDVTLKVPPLRQRKEDIGLQLGLYLQGLASRNRSLGISLGAFRALMLYHWPTNIPQFQAALDSAAAMHGDGERIELCDLPEDIRDTVDADTEKARVTTSFTSTLLLHRDKLRPPK